MTKNDKDDEAWANFSEEGKRELGVLIIKCYAWAALVSFVAGVAFTLACLGIVWAVVT